MQVAIWLNLQLLPLTNLRAAIAALREADRLRGARREEFVQQRDVWGRVNWFGPCETRWCSPDYVIDRYVVDRTPPLN